MAACLLAVAMFATPAVAPAQAPEPSGGELRDAYPLTEAVTPEPPARETRTAPPATHHADGGSSVQPIVAGGLTLLAFAAGFAFGLRPMRRRLPGALRVSAGGNR